MSNEINLRTASGGDTLLGLIQEKLSAENGGQSVNVNSVWNEILDVVDEQQKESGDVYSGGKERKNWASNYKIFVGQTITFSRAMWDKIRNIVGLGSNQKTTETPDTRQPEEHNIVPGEIDLSSGEYESKKVTNPDGGTKYIVNVEGKNVRYSSMDIEYNSEGKLIGYIQHFSEGDMAFDANNRLLPNGIHAVQTFRNETQQNEYKAALNNAKEILTSNASELGLSDEEIELIRKIDIESIDYGAARFDRQSGTLLFNINDKNTPNKNDFAKVIIHELTHATRGNPEQNSQAEERMCETRAIKCALKLIAEGKLQSFMLPPVVQGESPIDITTLSTDKQIDEYVNLWLKQQGYYRLPKRV